MHSRLDTKSESSKKVTTTRTQRQNIATGRKELDYHKRQDYSTANSEIQNYSPGGPANNHCANISGVFTEKVGSNSSITTVLEQLVNVPRIVERWAISNSNFYLLNYVIIRLIRYSPCAKSRNCRDQNNKVQRSRNNTEH